METSLQELLDNMQRHRMSLPPRYIAIRIPGAQALLEQYFHHFLSLQSKTFVPLDAYREVADWLEDNKGRGVILSGACGLGKSLLARFVLPAILLRHAGKVTSVYDVQQMNQNLDELLTKHILSLDDIGTEEVSVNYGNRRLAFAEIMDAAEKYGKLVIVTTNLTFSQLEARYGARVCERIFATMRSICFEGESLRK